MKTTITSRHFEASEQLKDFANEHLQTHSAEILCAMSSWNVCCGMSLCRYRSASFQKELFVYCTSGRKLAPILGARFRPKVWNQCGVHQLFTTCKP